MQTTASAVDWIDVLSKVTGPVLAAIAAAILATWFASNRFYREKWWEKRLSSFTEIIEISYRIKMIDNYFLECQDYQRNEGSRGFKPHPKDIHDRLVAEYWRDLQELERINQLSAFTLTPQTSEIMGDFLKKREQIRSDFHNDVMTSDECVEGDAEISRELLSKLVSEAKRCLKIKQ